MIKTFFILLLSCGFQFGIAQEIPAWRATDMVNYISDKKGAKVKVINMWATFCKPCIAEIPGFIDEVKKFENDVELMLISVDLKSHFPKKISDFAKSHHFNAPIVWLNETNADYFCPMLDKSWSGSIPATLIVNPSTGYRKFFEEEMSSEQLEKEIISALSGTTQ